MNNKPLTQVKLALANSAIDIAVAVGSYFVFLNFWQVDYLNLLIILFYGLVFLVYLIARYKHIPAVLPSFGSSLFKSIWSITLAVFLISGVLSNLLFSSYGIGLPILIMSLSSVIISTVIFYLIRLVLFKSQPARVKVLIIGVNNTTDKIIGRLNQPNQGFEVTGILDNVAKKGETIGGAPVLGKINTIEQVLNEQSIDLIIQIAGTEHTTTLMVLAEYRRIRFLILPQILGIPSRSIESTMLFNQLYLEPRGTSLSGWGQVGKRVFDFILSGLLLIILSPIFLLLAIIIKLTGPMAPVFVSQKRVDGRSGREFKMWRFRTLAKDAKDPEPTKENYRQFTREVPAKWNHPKASGFGRFLRKTHIMDLPQLWNVLIGDMGIVGPRPPFKAEYEEYDWIDRKRLLIKPGMTGVWQVSRKEYTFDEMVNLDRKYIEHWSFWLDISILVRSLGKFIIGRL
jgi:lipopolysaccharide/colanic/teichoic acid biosynthesis glycosyltransferase